MDTSYSGRTNSPIVSLTEDDEEISPDLSDLLPKIRKIIDQNVMKPVDPELCQLLKLLSEGLSIADRQDGFSKYLRDQEKMHLPASSTSHREIMEMVSSLNVFLAKLTLTADTVDQMKNKTLIHNHDLNTQPSEDINFDG
ncbi:unnamed protein product [Trichobilharzia szidati]|nr:unnamed protein product [Trichobilharzia szidati]